MLYIYSIFKKLMVNQSKIFRIIARIYCRYGLHASVMDIISKEMAENLKHQND